MGIRVRMLSTADGSWDHRVASVPEGHLYQTSNVEGFHIVTAGGFEPTYLVAEDRAGGVLGQLLILKGFHLAPELYSRPWLKGALGVCRSLFGSFTWTRGPLVFDYARADGVCQVLLDAVEAMARSDAYAIRQATLPHDPAGEMPRWCRGAVLEERGFVRSDKATFYVDLNRPIEDLWSGLKASARKNLKKMLAAATVEVVEIDTPERAKAYWAMLGETQRRGGRFTSYRNFAAFRGEFWDRPYDQGVLNGLLAQTSRGQPIGGLLFRVFNCWIQELGVAYTDYSITNKLYGQDLLKWALIEWGQRHGCCVFDLMGVDPQAEDDKQRGIYQFKAKWGGRLLNYGTYEKIYAPWKAGVMGASTRLARRERGNGQ